MAARADHRRRQRRSALHTEHPCPGEVARGVRGCCVVDTSGSRRSGARPRPRIPAGARQLEDALRVGRIRPPARRRAGDGARASRADDPAPVVVAGAAVRRLRCQRRHFGAGPLRDPRSTPGFHLVPVPRLLRQQLVSGREPRDRDDADLLSVWIRARTGAGGPAGRAGGADL